jgi:hypothetical protein
MDSPSSRCLKKRNKQRGLDVPEAMNHEPMTISRSGLDWKGLGYLVSIVSVFLLGAIAWPKDGEPAWYAPVLIAGIATSVTGMGFRYKAHLDQQRELKATKAKMRNR